MNTFVTLAELNCICLLKCMHGTCDAAIRPGAYVEHHNGSSKCRHEILLHEIPHWLENQLHPACTSLGIALQQVRVAASEGCYTNMYCIYQSNLNGLIVRQS